MSAFTNELMIIHKKEFIYFVYLKPFKIYENNELILKNLLLE